MVHVAESGEAVEEEAVFRAFPAAEHEVSKLPVPDVDAVESCRAAILADEITRNTVERLIITSGVARHETNDVMWVEETKRLHVSLVARQHRVLIDLATFDAAHVHTIASILSRVGKFEPAPERLRLAPSVSAALLPFALGDLAMEQRGSGRDGDGWLIETRAVTAGLPPNRYRPSYAIRPVPAWHNVLAFPFGRIDDSAPLAVGLLSRAHGSELHVLCVDIDEIFSTTITAPVVTAVSDEEPSWYPYAAGSFGAVMML